MQIGTHMIGVVIFGTDPYKRRMLCIKDIRDVTIGRAGDGRAMATMQVVYDGTATAETVVLIGDEAESVVKYLDMLSVEVAQAAREVKEGLMKEMVGGIPEGVQ